MTEKKKSKYTILIADDSEMNRAILADMLGDEYEIIEAENGVEAVIALQKYGTELSLVLLDIVMPEMDGFGVLKVMNERRWIEAIPVIMISAESGASHVERAYKLGVTDFISRPFDAMIVHRRVVNTILLYAKQKRLANLVAEQVYEKEQQSGLMIDILSHIVEFRNGESGLHVVHIRTLTEMLAKQLAHRSEEYAFTHTDISRIATASALHDIGKIAIDNAILNKPGRLTDEEFAIMKTHATVGAKMLKELSIHQNEPLVKTAYEICRWHHERYDGRGYPDGLKGDDIPIAAQIVSLADVYDALTSERVYKKAFSHQTALEMINDGQCGCFNPLLLQCLADIADSIPRELSEGARGYAGQAGTQNITQELLAREALTASERTLQLIEQERKKYNFFAAISEEIQFEYVMMPPMLTLCAWGAQKLGLPETLMDPMGNKTVRGILGEAQWSALFGRIEATTPDNPRAQYECMARIDGEERWVRFICQTQWSEEAPYALNGVIGKVIDIHEDKTRLEALKAQLAQK